MSEEKLTPSILYTTEAEESKKKAEEEMDIPDPEDETAAEIILKFKQEETGLSEKKAKDSHTKGDE